MHRRAGRPRDRRATRRCCARVNPRYAVTFFARRRPDTASWSWARWSSSSPAARRSTPTWATSGSGRSGSPGSAWSCPRCCSTTSARARCCCTDPDGGRESVLRSGPALGCSIRWSGSRRCRGDRRLAGAHLRRLLAHAAGGAARLLPARDHRPHVAHRDGQIYIPEVNQAALDRLRAAGARRSESSTNLAAAYGIAVTGTMIITSILFYRRRARRAGAGAGSRRGLLTGLFLVVDLAFFGANLVKIPRAAGSRS